MDLTMDEIQLLITSLDSCLEDDEADQEALNELIKKLCDELKSRLDEEGGE